MPESIIQFIDNFLKHSRNLGNVKENTQEVRERVLRNLEEFCQKKEIEIQLNNPGETKSKIKEFFESDEVDFKPHGMNIAALTRFFRYLGDYQNYDEDAIRYSILAIKDLQISYDRSDTLQNVEEGNMSFRKKEKLIRAAKSSEKALQKEIMLRLIMEAGLRRVELLALEKQHVNFDSSINPVTIDVVKKRIQGEGDDEKKNERTVAASLETRVKIKELIEEKGREDRDCLIWENASYNVPQDWLNEIVERAGIEERDVKIRELRRNAIVELVQKEVDQFRIPEYYGPKTAVNQDVVEKFSPKNPSNRPLAENKRIF